MRLMVDLRLLEVSIELSTLERYLEFIEEQEKRGREAAECELQTKWRELSCDDEAEWSLLCQERDFQVEFVLPRILRGPFLVTLFAVYETAVTEIGKLIQEKKGVQISLDDLRGDLLSRAKKYYGNVLQFELSKGNQHWERLTLLSDLRNAIAHTNGLLDMMRQGTKRRILRIEGVSERFGCIVVDEHLLRDTFTLVKEDVEALVGRYKQWDTARRASLNSDE